MTNDKKEGGGEFFRTDSRLVFGAYFCEKGEDGTYTAKMYGCDAITDQQANSPQQAYASRHEIRSNLALLLETISQEAMPRSEKEAALIRDTRQQLQELLIRLRDEEENGLPDLVPTEEVQEDLEEAFAAAVQITQNIEESIERKGGSKRQVSDSLENPLPGIDSGRTDLDPSAIQKLKADLQEAVDAFQGHLGALEELGGDEAGIQVLFPHLLRGYNSIVLFASILEENGYRAPGLREYGGEVLAFMQTLTEQMGGDVFSIRSPRGVRRPFPPHPSSFDEGEWSALMQRYEDAVHRMAMAEHVAERLAPSLGNEYMYRMLIHAYNTFIRSAKEVQRSSGPLRHYTMLKGVLEPQLHRLAEAVDIPEEELEQM